MTTMLESSFARPNCLSFIFSYITRNAENNILFYNLSKNVENKVGAKLKTQCQGRCQNIQAWFFMWQPSGYIFLIQHKYNSMLIQCLLQRQRPTIAKGVMAQMVQLKTERSWVQSLAKANKKQNYFSLFFCRLLWNL